MYVNAKSKTIASLLFILVLSACGGGGGGGGSSSSSSSTGNTSTIGIAATGAPLGSMPVTVKDLSGATVSTFTTAADGSFALTLPASSSESAYIVTVMDTGVSPTKEYRAYLLKSDIENNKPISVTPLSEMVATYIGSTGTPKSMTLTQLQKARSDGAQIVQKAIQPILTRLGVTDTVEQLLNTSFTPITSSIDKALDQFTVSCSSTTKNCDIHLTSATADQAMGNGNLVLNLSSTVQAEQSSTSIATTLNKPEIIDAAAKTAPIVVVFGYESKWGTAADSWAGYSGKLAIYNFSDSPINGGTTLYFESNKLKAQGFWNVSAGSSKDGKISLTLPEWGTIPPTSRGGAQKPFVVGFNGQGDPSQVNDLVACNIGGVKCLAALDLPSAQLPNGSTAKWATVVASLTPSVGQTSGITPTAPTPEVPAASTNPENQTSKPQTNTSPNAQNTFQISIGATSSWDGGFNGNLVLNNATQTAVTSWQVSFTLPDGLRSIGSWGNYKLETTGTKVTFNNESWNGSLPIGKELSLGFGGSGTLTTAPTNCKLKLNNGAEQSCQITLAAATTSNNTNTTTPSTPIAPPPTPPAPSPVVSQPVAPPVGAIGDLLSEPTTIGASTKADQTKRVYVGYYPSWSDNWFSSKSWDGKALTDDQILTASKLARIPAVYTHIVVAFAQPNISYSTANNFNANRWDGTGLNFNAGPQDIKRAIEVLHSRNFKVLLAVGGATYNDWAELAAEGNNKQTGPRTTALTQLVTDLGFDGLDVDYEVEGTTQERITEYRGAIIAMRRALDQAGGSKTLALAGWSTGGDCTAQTGTNAIVCSGTTSYWGGSAGRERLVFADTSVRNMIDMVNIMSYDARYEHYDGVAAWKAYRDIMPSGTIVSIGLETAPEGWAGGKLVIKNAQASCAGSIILQNQYGASLNLPYSVERYANAVMESRTNSNPRDGAMLWQILKYATESCGSSVVASPPTIAKEISRIYNLPDDSARKAWN